MREPLSPNDVRSLWQSQTTQPQIVSLDEIRKKAEQFQRKIRQRNGIEYFVAIVAAPFLALLVIWMDKNSVVRMGLGLTIIGMAYAVYYRWTRAGARLLPQESILENCLAFHRREMERHRNLLRTAWRWDLAPFIPGMLVLATGLCIDAVTQGRRQLIHAATSCLILVIVCVGSLCYYRWAAKNLDKEIRALDAYEIDLNAHLKM